MRVERELTALRAPDEPAAQARAWEVVRAALRDQGPRPRRASHRWLALAPATVAVVAALTLTPAGATVGRLIGHALGVPHAARALLSLPAPGRLLVSGSDETWIVSSDGSRRRLGRWRQASWSPHGTYVAVASDDRLAAVDPRGAIQWSLARPQVSDPRWYPPTGFRIAYRSGSTLRVVAGDGTGDHLLATGVSPIPPAWRPGHPYQLAYVQGDRVVLRDADSGGVTWTRPVRAPVGLGWSADGALLLIVTRTGARVLAGDGRTTATIVAGRDQVRDGSLSPDGRVLALVGSRGMAIARLGPARPALVTVLSGPGIRQVTWSPNSEWLLASWPPADQWVFVDVGGHGPRIAAVSRIAQQFSPVPRPAAFPRLDGWCCSAHGPTG